MIKWWLNRRWYAEVHADALAKIDVAIALFATLAVAALMVR